MEQRTQVGVECPLCRWRSFLEVEVDRPEDKPPSLREIRAELEAWVASRCPQHLGPILESSKN